MNEPGKNSQPAAVEGDYKDGSKREPSRGAVTGRGLPSAQPSAFGVRKGGGGV